VNVSVPLWVFVPWNAIFPVSVDVPENVPEREPPPESAAVDETAKVDRVVAPVTPRVPVAERFPVTATLPLKPVALSVAGIIAAVSAQAIGVAVEPVQLPMTVFGDCVLKSAGKSDRNSGVPELPFGDANTRFWDSDASATVRDPEPVTGELLTLNIDGMERPMEVTVPMPANTTYE